MSFDCKRVFSLKNYWHGTSLHPYSFEQIARVISNFHRQKSVSGLIAIAQRYEQIQAEFIRDIHQKIGCKDPVEYADIAAVRNFEALQIMITSGVSSNETKKRIQLLNSGQSDSGTAAWKKLYNKAMNNNCLPPEQGNVIRLSAYSDVEYESTGYQDLTPN